MLKNGFHINECDKCVYYKQIGHSYVMICLCVDDMIIFGPNIQIIETIKKMLIKNFDMKDLGVADVILEIKIIRTPNEIELSQSHYIAKVIEKFQNFDIKSVRTPYNPSKVATRHSKRQSLAALATLCAKEKIDGVQNNETRDAEIEISRPLQNLILTAKRSPRKHTVHSVNTTEMQPPNIIHSPNIIPTNSDHTIDAQNNSSNLSNDDFRLEPV